MSLDRQGIDNLADDLRQAVQSVRAQLSTPDARAYAALFRAGQLQPHTEEAEAIWATAGGHDPWRHHHRAVLLHAAAYDLEANDPERAVGYWRAALQEWSLVHRDDDFWRRIGRSVGQALARELDPAVLAEVRRSLPASLLGVHVSLVRRYLEADPARARRHMDLLERSPFDVDLKRALRDQLRPLTLGEVADGCDAGDFEPLLRRLDAYREVAPDDPVACRQVLYVYHRWNLKVHTSGDTRRLRDNLSREAGAAHGWFATRVPAIPLTEAEREDLAAEIARHQCWDGVTSLIEAQGSWSAAEQSWSATALRQVRKLARRSVDLLNKALSTDAAITADPVYASIPYLKSQAYHLAGRADRVLADLGQRDRYRSAAADLRRSLELKEWGASQYIDLALCLIRGRHDRAALEEAGQLLDRAADLAAQTPEPDDDIAVREVHEELDRLLRPW